METLETDQRPLDQPRADGTERHGQGQASPRVIRPRSAGVRRVAFIGNALPRRCGIATFTSDLQQAIQGSAPRLSTAIIAMTDPGQAYAYPASVTFAIDQDVPEDYRLAADYLNGGDFDVVCLQHEFGIFGGPAGEHILQLLEHLAVPVVTTLHTVLEEPNAAQRRVVQAIAAASATVVVMAEHGRRLLRRVYAVPDAKIAVIPHGIPDFPFVDPDAAKAELGFAGRSVVLTFGLLSPNKGIEATIDAMPAILAARPDAVYVVLGATHPHFVRDRGETYREDLQARARALGVADHVVFIDRFFDLPTLLGHIAMCDVYVTPYRDLAQLTSGTLAYSFGLGKAVVSTPYAHARELLAEGRGVLVPVGDVGALAGEIAALLTDDVRRDAIRVEAYAHSRSMTWACAALRYRAVFEAARRRPRVVPTVDRKTADPQPPDLPELAIDHLLAMYDDTGLFQHALHDLPDRSHGYCIDDNARALLLDAALEVAGEAPLPASLTVASAAFVQHAWNPATRRFRNFMSYDRRWLEAIGSEDSHGRALWALGVCAESDPCRVRRAWAAGLFATALPTAVDFTSPRAWAFTLLGLDGYCAVAPGDEAAAEVRCRLAERLMALLAAVETSSWIWFETGLAYDNARLPQALLVTGGALQEPAYVAAGLRSLRWLMDAQTAPTGCFRPVGTAGFGDADQSPPEPFDQQPVEAAAAIAACVAAWQADGDDAWLVEAYRAFAWFLGNNDLAIPLVDLETGSCRDGLHPERANENRGAESVLAFLTGLAELRRLEHDREPRPDRLQRAALHLAPT
jgi:glycosyltransferase involved in cell wall biosynthesis